MKCLFPHRRSGLQTLAFASVAGTFILMLAWQWGKLGDPVRDYGRDPYTAWQIVEGRALYEDLAYLYGPLSPYLNALWFKLFGTTLRTLDCANAALLILTIALLIGIFKRAFGLLGATIAVCCFIVLFGLGNFTRIANYNFITPYTHAATHGFLLAVASMACWSAYIGTAKPHWLAVSSALAGVSFFAKPEFFAASSLTLLLGVALRLWLRQGTLREMASVGGLAVVSWAAGFTLTFAALSAFTSPGALWSGTWRGYEMGLDPQIRAMRFFQESAGTRFLSRSVFKLIAYACVYLQCILPAALAAIMLRRFRWWTLPIVGCAWGAGFYFVRAAVHAHKFQADAARGIPLLVLLILCATAIYLYRLRKRRESSTRHEVLLMLCIFALAMQLRITLNFRVYHYGFVQAAIAFMVCAAMLAVELPRLIHRIGGQAWIFQIWMIGLLAAFIAFHLRTTQLLLSERTVILSTGDNRMQVAASAAGLARVIDHLKQTSNPGESLAVIPEGGMTNFLTDRPNPTPYELLKPEGFIWAGGTCLILSSFVESRPDLILVLGMDTSQFGAQRFGGDYGQELMIWIAENYDVVYAEPETDGSGASQMKIELYRLRNLSRR